MNENLDNSKLDFKFPKKFIIRYKKDIDGFYKSPSVSCIFLLIAYKKNNLEHSRIFLRVKKKIGNAPKRNLLKRKSKEFFRTNKFLIKNGYDFCFVFKKDYFESQKVLSILGNAKLLITQ